MIKIISSKKIFTKLGAFLRKTSAFGNLIYTCDQPMKLNFSRQIYFLKHYYLSLDVLLITLKVVLVQDYYQRHIERQWELVPTKMHRKNRIHQSPNSFLSMTVVKPSCGLTRNILWKPMSDCAELTWYYSLRPYPWLIVRPVHCN